LGRAVEQFRLVATGGAMKVKGVRVRFHPAILHSTRRLMPGGGAGKTVKNLPI
jgi:hypothetical protein